MGTEKPYKHTHHTHYTLSHTKTDPSTKILFQKKNFMTTDLSSRFVTVKSGLRRFFEITRWGLVAVVASAIVISALKMKKF